MQPSKAVRIHRQKVRKFRQKCRRPFAQMTVDAFLIKLESAESSSSSSSAVQLRRRKQIEFDRIAKSSRLPNIFILENQTLYYRSSNNFKIENKTFLLESRTYFLRLTYLLITLMTVKIILKVITFEFLTVYFQ
jgi:hypothetical protein